MDDSKKAEYEQKSKLLRADLKKWESEWALSHNGAKPSRQDIKENPIIAGKYKEYNKARDILAGKTPVPAKEPPPNPKKRRPDHPPVETPRKKHNYTETPVKNRIYADDEQFMSTPAISRKLFSPAPVTSIGPTPQRDGRVLGLFDLLVEKELGTPSRRADNLPSTPGRHRNIDATPSKRRGSFDTEKLGRTPMSSSKRHMLNTFMTPLKNRDNTAGGKTPTPGSVSKLQFDTPAFLRRHTLPALSEDTTFDAPAPLKLPRKPLGRGLSEIVASLRRVEDDKLDDDDDMAALREAEEADVNPAAGPARPVTAPAAESIKQNLILAPDREAQNLPLGGFDDEGRYDSPDEMQTGPNGQPLVVYKKKGQKRTTRRVNMRPTITKRPSEPLGASEDITPETQIGGQGIDFAAGELSGGDGGANSNKKKQQQPPVQTEGVVKKSVRKVNELAHANFRRLKLRSKNLKGKGGGGFRRFGRR